MPLSVMPMCTGQVSVHLLRPGSAHAVAPRGYGSPVSDPAVGSRRFVAGAWRPDLLLLHDHLAGKLSGLDAIIALQRAHGSMPIPVFTIAGNPADNQGMKARGRHRQPTLRLPPRRARASRLRAQRLHASSRASTGERAGYRHAC